MTIKRLLCVWFVCVVVVSAAKADDVMVTDSTHVEACMTGAVVSRHRTLLIPDESHADAAAWTLTLDKNQKLKSFGATYSDATGRVLKKFKKGDLQMSEYTDALSDDSRTYYIGYSPVAYPIKVSFDWAVDEQGGVIAYPMFAPMDDYDQEVKRAVYVIRCDADNPCRYKPLHCESLLQHKEQGQLVVKQDNDGIIKAVMTDVMPIKKEPYSLPLIKRMPMMIFSPDSFFYLGTKGRLDTWQNFGRWQYDLLKGRDGLPDDVKQTIHQQTDGLASKREKIARLYQYLYDNTRYVSIQLGIGGYQPAMAGDVAKNGFGDCKGLSNLMIAMLREVGIPAIYATISTTYADLLDDFPNMNQLDHAIVCVPMERDSLWLECTNARMPLGYVHEDIAGHEAILITEQGGVKVRLPQYADEANEKKSEIDMMIDAQDMLTMRGQVVCVNRAFETLMPLTTLSRNDCQKVILDRMFFPAAQVKQFDISEEKGKAEMNIQMQISSDRYVNRSGKRLFVCVNPLKAKMKTMSLYSNCLSSFYIDDGYCDEETITIRWPKGYRVETMPADETINSQKVSFRVEYKQEGNAICAHFRLLIHRGRYEATDYNDFVNMLNAITKSYQKQLVLIGL